MVEEDSGQFCKHPRSCFLPMTLWNLSLLQLLSNLLTQFRQYVSEDLLGTLGEYIV